MIEKIRLWFDRKLGWFHKPKSIEEMDGIDFADFWQNVMGFPLRERT